MKYPMTAVRLTPAELAELRVEAKKAGTSVSEFIRRRLNLKSTAKAAALAAALAAAEGRPAKKAAA